MTCHGASVGVIIRHGDQGLLIRRAKGPQAGTWAFPAGHQETGETTAQTGTREVSEEVDLEFGTADLGDPVLTGRFADECRHGTTHHAWTVYEVEIPAGQMPIRDQAETLGMCWAPIAQWGYLQLEPVWRLMLTKTGHIT